MFRAHIALLRSAKRILNKGYKHRAPTERQTYSQQGL